MFNDIVGGGMSTLIQLGEQLLLAYVARETFENPPWGDVGQGGRDEAKTLSEKR